MWQVFKSLEESRLKKIQLSKKKYFRDIHGIFGGLWIPYCSWPHHPFRAATKQVDMPCYQYWPCLYLHPPDDGIDPLGRGLHGGLQVPGGEGDVAHAVVALQGVRDVLVALQERVRSMFGQGLLLIRQNLFFLYWSKLSLFQS